MTPVKRPPAPRADCDHTKPSALIVGHQHTCNGVHMDDDLHKCSDPTCRRWFA